MITTLPVPPETEDAQSQVPSTPTDEQTSSQRLPMNTQSVPDTPFSKTLNYYKQFQGARNLPIKRRRTTALPTEIAEVTELAIDANNEAESGAHKGPQSTSPEASALPATSALDELQELVSPEASGNAVDFPHAAEENDDPDQPSESTDHERVVDQNVADTDSVADETQKQLILYPQHPPFVNAIGMIPATMFWTTAAPIVKYTNIAIEMLIDKLRDT